MSLFSRLNRPPNLEAARRPDNLRFLMQLVLVLAVAAIACSSDRAANSSTSIIGDESSNAGYEAPSFSFSMYQGTEVVGGENMDLHSLVGPKPIVLNFWAGLCPPCRAEMPDLHEFDEEYRDRILLLGIDVGHFFGLGSQDDAKELLEELGVAYPAGFTNDSDVIKDYRVLGMPTTFFIDTDGAISNQWTGALNRSVLVRETKKMLAQ